MNDQPKKWMKKEERAEQILEAARKVFVEKGYKGATTMEIAQSAGISEVTLFRHFSSKQDIFMQAIEPVLTETLKDAIGSSNKLGSKERIKHILTDRIKLISKNQDLIKLILMESQIQNELPSINIVEKHTDMLKKMINEMGIPEHKTDFILRMLMGAILSFLFMPKAAKERIDAFVEQMVQFIT